MTKLPLKYIDRFRDRHGRDRYYFRRPGGDRTPLPGLPGSTEFIAAYHAAMSGVEPRKANMPPVSSARSFDRLAFEYFASPQYLSRAPSTRYASRKAIERMIRDENIGHRLVAEMERRHVMSIVAKHKDRPGAANDYLKKLRTLIRFSILLEWRKDDPTTLVKGYRSGEWHTWTDDEIAAYEARWPVGTPERTAFALLLYTSQRLADVARMTWADAQGGKIAVVQSKTGTRLQIPVHPELLKALEAHERRGVVILVSLPGRPFSTKGFGNWMAKNIEAAGLPPGCVTHGIRKASARRMAEAGLSAKQIGSLTGHRTLKEVSRYTAAADQVKLAESAIRALTEHDGNSNSQTLDKFGKKAPKS